MLQYVVAASTALAAYHGALIEGAAAPFSNDYVVAQHSESRMLSNMGYVVGEKLSTRTPDFCALNSDDVQYNIRIHDWEYVYNSVGTWVRHVDKSPSGQSLGFIHAETNACYSAPHFTNHSYASTGLAPWNGSKFVPENGPLFPQKYETLKGAPQPEKPTRVNDELRWFGGLTQFSLAKADAWLYGAFNIANRWPSYVRFPANMLYDSQGNHNLAAIRDVSNWQRFTDSGWSNNFSGVYEEAINAKGILLAYDVDNGDLVNINIDPDKGIVINRSVGDVNGDWDVNFDQEGLLFPYVQTPGIYYKPEHEFIRNPTISNVDPYGDGRQFEGSFNLVYSYSFPGQVNTSGALVKQRVDVIQAPDHHPKSKIALARYRKIGSSDVFESTKYVDDGTMLSTIAYLWTEKYADRPMTALFDGKNGDDKWTRYKKYWAVDNDPVQHGFDVSERMLGWIIPFDSRSLFPEFSDSELRKLYRVSRHSERYDNWISYAEGDAVDADEITRLMNTHGAAESDIVFLGWALK